jgi:hypothetical protein
MKEEAMIVSIVQPLSGDMVGDGRVQGVGVFSKDNEMVNEVETRRWSVHIEFGRDTPDKDKQ